MDETIFGKNSDPDPDSISEEFCKSFFSNEMGTEENNEKISGYVDFLQKKDYEHVPYSIIGKYVYENNIDDFDIEKNCNELSTILKENLNNEFINKTKEYIRLACFQKKYVKDNYENLENDVKDLEDRSEKSEKKLKDIEHNLGGIYAEIVALLGIFTAIAFSIFGGLQVVSSLFSKLRFSEPLISLGYVLIIGAIIGVFIYGILIILFEGIYKLTSFYDRKEVVNYPVHKGLKKYILSILGIMAIVGIIFILINTNLEAILTTVSKIISMSR